MPEVRRSIRGPRSRPSDAWRRVEICGPSTCRRRFGWKHMDAQRHLGPHRATGYRSGTRSPLATMRDSMGLSCTSDGRTGLLPGTWGSAASRRAGMCMWDRRSATWERVWLAISDTRSRRTGTSTTCAPWRAWNRSGSGRGAREASAGRMAGSRHSSAQAFRGKDSARQIAVASLTSRGLARSPSCVMARVRQGLS